MYENRFFFEKDFDIIEYGLNLLKNFNSNLFFTKIYLVKEPRNFKARSNIPLQEGEHQGSQHFYRSGHIL